ncbi:MULTISPECIES: DUF3040 domain-containing protein [unclassified Streptomyces]|jgi:hypothetical protein|uniref:DUF3040 domain-containing protein n=1 Tax=unclassified Streptomyces TaxID=2593676 RepID=UPI000F4D5826|nr:MULTISPECIES: DUF3040 domain-containing protein [unclassified Streptomyces]MDH6456353.1 hypothetical protein [Streptomyces sp. SAI-119]MDH6501718.1 hypothetical protein [Streptomyces sp. SAI-149]QUC59863.1 DUF3040 domain-containing protein [Streptomyces sp. A2-16]GLP65486.1 hypothetical protein TUSST3_21060 [Streptomyces sp. TUS-ST3]
MRQPDDEHLIHLAARLERDDPRFARALGSGRPARPREYRRTGAWSTLAVAVTLLIVGMVLPEGILVAGGLVLAGIAVPLFDPHRDRPHR